MIGSTIGHYSILEKLGEGGMGIVYKAQDTKLNRTVALKFLPDRVQKDSEAKARFLQEAQAAAGLNHPNICTIHGVEETDGQLYMVMEYVEGGTLAEKLPFAKIDDAVSVASQIAQALQKAHEKGIVHRDVKADNIMLTSDGQAKVMDFGLAKLKGALKLTRTSSTVGTLGYMAPEQIQGGEVDHRSDIFSFGVLFFEILTDKLPFRGEHEAAMVYSIVNETPTDIASLKPDISPIISNLIHRCLEKDPTERYQHFDDIRADLKRSQKKTSRVMRSSSHIVSPSATEQDRVAPEHSKTPEVRSLFVGGKSRLYIIGSLVALAAILLFLTNPFSDGKGGSAEKTRLVVLPFQNQGPSDQDYFVDGITEEIIGRLSGVSQLSVIARSSSMQYKATSKTLKEIGAELGVSYALLGTVRWSQQTGSEARLRIIPELVRVDDATQVWSEPIEAAYSSGFELQSRIASQVASALGVSLVAVDHTSLEKPLTENAEAYNLYLKGNDYLSRAIEDRVNHEFAEQMFKKAIDLDPTFAAAWAKLSLVHTNMRWFHWDLTEQRLESGRIAAEKAVQMDPTLALAHAAMGNYFYHGLLEYDPALKSFRKSLAIDPSQREALLGLGSVLRRQGKMPEALPYFEQASAIDPRSAEVALEVAYTQECLRNYAAGSREYERAISLAPDEAVYYVYQANILISWKGDVAAARRVFAVAAERHVPDNNHTIANAAAIIAYSHRDYQEALGLLKSSGPLAIDDQISLFPAALLKGLILTSDKSGDPSLEFASARRLLEQRIKEFPEDSRAYTSLGIALAGLGRKDEAMKRAKEGVAILPSSKEALRGAAREFDLARVYAMVGEFDRALDQLERIPPNSNFPTYGDLKLMPVWDPLRELPRFTKLLTSLEPED